MDVTFFETKPYYPKIDIQGENSSQSQQEYQFFLDSIDYTPLEIAPSPSVQIEPEPKPTDSVSPELSVYHKKRGKSKESETLADSPLLSAFEPKVKIPKSESHTMEKNSTCTSLSDHDNSDENIPIALMKGVRECRGRPLYPIGNYVRYESLIFILPSINQ